MIDRRQFLHAGVRAGAALGIAKALTNTVVGYGEFGLGDNLVDDPPVALAREHMPTGAGVRHQAEDWELRGRSDGIELRPVGGTWQPRGRADAPDVVTATADRLDALRRGRFSFAFLPLPEFFELVAAHTPLPAIVRVLRGHSGFVPDADTVGAFARADPGDVASLVHGLADGFARTTRYDAERYVAGAIEDNLLPVRTDLRGWFRPRYSFDTLVDADQTNLFCGEYAVLANRAFRAVSLAAQDPPVTGLRVVNRRHKHVHNGLASAIETDDGLVIPVAFVDYTYTTLYADLRIDGYAGDSPDAFDRRHRADQIWW